MSRQEFIDKAKEYGYDEQGIKDLLETYREMREINPDADYDEIILVPQPVY